MKSTFVLSNNRSFLTYFVPLQCLGHIPFQLLLFGLVLRYRPSFKISTETNLVHDVGMCTTMENKNFQENKNFILQHLNKINKYSYFILNAQKIFIKRERGLARLVARGCREERARRRARVSPQDTAAVTGLHTCGKRALGTTQCITASHHTDNITSYS